MKYNPHNYQKYAIEFIKQHPIAAILLDMGMGKTSIVLSALNELMYNSFEVTKILIIAPLRVARNTWSDEIKKWDHLKGLRYSIAVGTATERKKALAADADIFIINEALRDEFVLQLPGGEITASNAATLSGKLSQLANGAIYSDDGDVNIFHERKLDALEDLIEAANGKPVLVAYWFKHDLRRISERLSNLGIDYQQLDSDASIKKWNAGQLQVGLIHPASAGHGLNLQSGGNILVWFGITWSLELYQQTVARLWRQGQTEGTVSVIHIVTDGTVDERILKALEAKDLTQSALIDAVKAEVGDGK